MKSAWIDQDADETVARYADEGVNEDLALRLYTTRLLGRNPLLVLHGGGNTSVKTTVTDLLGEDVQVLCVKGSGWDMADIESPGLPAVRMEPLLKLRSLNELSDEDMVRFQRGALVDPSSPNPSVETLLHAFLPHKFVDHTHSAAVLALTDQAVDEPLLREVYGDRVALVDYVKPGFDLAQAAALVYEAHPGVEGLILRKHGIFSFGATAREAYERMVDLVTLAENHIAEAGEGLFPSAELPSELSPVSEVAPIIRGLLAVRGDESVADPVRMILKFRTSEAVLNYMNGLELGRYSQVGVVTPDHVIRTKKTPLVVPVPEGGAGEGIPGRGGRGDRKIRGRLPRLLRPPRRGARATEEGAGPNAPSGAGTGAGSVRRRKLRCCRPYRRRPCREYRAGHHRRGSHRRIPAGGRGRHVRH